MLQRILNTLFHKTALTPEEAEYRRKRDEWIKERAKLLRRMKLLQMKLHSGNPFNTNVENPKVRVELDAISRRLDYFESEQPKQAVKPSEIN